MPNFHVWAILLCISATLISSWPVSIAQEIEPLPHKTPVHFAPVFYQPDFPVTVGRALPPKSRSRLWAKTDWQEKGAPVFAHIYDRGEIQKDTVFSPPYTLSSYYRRSGNVQHAVLELWAKGRNGKYRRLSITPFSYGRDWQDREEGKIFENWFEAFTLFLRPKAKQTPVFDLVESTPGVFGRIDFHIWFVFVNGFSKPASVHGFPNGASNVDNLSIDWVSTDGMGQLLVQTHYWQISQMVKRLTWKWKNGQFVPSKD